MPGEAELQETGFFTALHVRPYLYVWLSSMLSGSGQWTLVIGRGLLVQNLTGSAGWVGLTLFASWLPYIFATPIGGVLADRIERRKLSAAMQGFSLFASLLLAVLTVTGAVTPWEVVAVAVMAGIGRSIETPSTTALIPTLVPSRYLLNAISLNSMAVFGSQFVGAALAFIVFKIGNLGSVFFVTAACYAVAMFLIARSGSRPLPAHARFNPWHETTDTWKYIAGAAMIPTIILIGALHCGLTMTKDAILPGFTKQYLHGSGSTLSLLQMGFGAGSMVGTFALGGLRTEEAKGPLFLISGLASGLTVVLLAFARAPLAAFLVLAVVGASQGMFMALGTTLVQQVVPDHLRGRVTSAYTMATGGLMSFGGLGAGALADTFGIPAVLIVPSLVFVAAVVGLTMLRPGLRLLYRTGVLPGDAPLRTTAVSI